MNRITQILDALDGGDTEVGEDFLPEVYKELRNLAAQRMARHAPGQTLQATALVHEVWLRFDKGKHRRWKSRRHFFLTASKAMAQILIDRARRKLALRRGAGGEHVDAELIAIAAPVPEDSLLLLNDALQEFQRIDPEKAEIVTMRFFAGFSEIEISEILGISERTVRRHWAFAKAWLFDRVEELRNS